MKVFFDFFDNYGKAKFQLRPLAFLLSFGYSRAILDLLIVFCPIYSDIVQQLFSQSTEIDFMRKIELSITALATSDNQPNSFVVVLKEEQGNRRLPIVIGGFEAQAIAIALEKINPTRPLTHDLFKNLLDALGVNLEEIIVSDLKAGVFYATLVCRRQDGGALEMDARTSDAIAMAVRYACPIYAYDFVLDEAGITLESEQEARTSENEAMPIHKQPAETLEKLLEEALAKEDYERAAQLRDELRRRKENGG